MRSDPQQDLAYIRQVMEQTRRFTVISGSYMIVWGLLISAGLGFDLWELHTGARIPDGDIWLGLIVAGWLLTFWLQRREARYEPVASYASRLIGQIWLACGVAMTVAFTVGAMTGAVPGSSDGGLMALFVGIGVFMTGVLTGMAWFRNLALGWLTASIAMFVWHGQAAMWISLGLLLGLFVVPGVILNLQAKALRKTQP